MPCAAAAAASAAAAAAAAAAGAAASDTVVILAMVMLAMGCFGYPWVRHPVLYLIVSHCISSPALATDLECEAPKRDFISALWTRAPFKVADLACAAVSHTLIYPAFSATVMVGVTVGCCQVKTVLDFIDRRLTFLYVSHRSARLGSFAASQACGHSLQWPTVLQPRPCGLLPRKRFNWCQGIAFCCQPRALSQPAHSTGMLKSMQPFLSLAVGALRWRTPGCLQIFAGYQGLQLTLFTNSSEHRLVIPQSMDDSWRKPALRS